MLKILVHTPQTGDLLGVLQADSRDEIEGTFFEGVPGRVPLWGTFNRSDIQKDVIVVEEKYRSLVCLIHICQCEILKIRRPLAPSSL
jgi:hypothetical protein